MSVLYATYADLPDLFRICRNSHPQLSTTKRNTKTWILNSSTCLRPFSMKPICFLRICWVNPDFSIHSLHKQNVTHTCTPQAYTSVPPQAWHISLVPNMNYACFRWNLCGSKTLREICRFTEPPFFNTSFDWLILTRRLLRPRDDWYDRSSKLRWNMHQESLNLQQNLEDRNTA